MGDCEKDKMETEMSEKEDADESLVTMVDVLQEQEAFEENANAVLGASDEKHCTYLKGYVKRQALYACLTCCPESRTDASKRAGVCLACSLACHENHELVELYTKRNFRCDCGTPKLASPCQFAPQKRELNKDNVYNQNFCGLYCECHRPYPDPEFPKNDEMIQCIICEDWWHSTHLDAKVPSNDQYSEMICKLCMAKNDFLYEYSIYSIKGDDENDTDENIDIEGTLNSISGDNSETKMLSAHIDKEAYIKDDLSVIETALQGTVGDDLETKMLDSATVIEAVGSATIIKDNVPDVKTTLYGTVEENFETEMLDSATNDKKAISEDNIVKIAMNYSTGGQNGTVGENLEDKTLYSATINKLRSKDDVPTATNIFVGEFLSTDNTKKDTCRDVHGTGDDQNIATVSANELTKVDNIISTKMNDAQRERKSDESNSTSIEIVKTDQLAAEPKDKTEANSEPETSDNIENKNYLDKNDQLDNIDDSNSGVMLDEKPKRDMQEESLAKDLSNDTVSVNRNDNNNFNNHDLPTTVEMATGESSRESTSKRDELIYIQGQDGEDMNVDVHPSKTGVAMDLDTDMATEPNIAVQETKLSINSEAKKIASEENKEIYGEKNTENNTSDLPEIEHYSDQTPKTSNKKVDDLEEEAKSSVMNGNEQPLKKVTNLDSGIENISEAVEAELLNEEAPEVKKENSSVDQITDNKEVDKSITIDKEEIHAINEECNKNENALQIQNDDITNNVKYITEDMDVDKPNEKASDNGSECSKDSDLGKNITISDCNNESSTETSIIISTSNDNAQQTTENDNIEIESPLTNKEQTKEKEHLVEEIDNNKENENLLYAPKTEKCKRKLSESDDICTKKSKLDGGKGACSRPSIGAPRTKGSTFWPCSWRQRLCSCLECVSMYRVRDVLFLLDMEDTVTAYEDLGKGKNTPSHYEKGLEALSSLGHVQQINAITQYNNMKEKLLEFLKGFKDNRQVVREEDIKEFFAGMKPQRESDGVYFCR